MQARAHKTRAAILTAAAHQFDVLGYAETTISTIIATGELTKGSIYFHFSSKEAIAKHLIDDWTRTLLETITASDTRTSTPEQIRCVFSEIARNVAGNTHLRAGMKLTLEASIDNAAFTYWIREIDALIQTAITADELDDHPLIHRLAWNLCTGTVGAAHAQTGAAENFSLVTRIDDVVDAHLRTAVSTLCQNTSR
ncbi:TetR/AcrR family transcriptional regulator (plasmid) [Rhodococcus qingshengii]|nr:TetR/AcrR family transcriptional regulator [Rhodococcus qingshengii]